MKRVVRIKAQYDGRAVKLEAHVDQPSYFTRHEQEVYVTKISNALHSALRDVGFACPEIKFGK